MVISYDYSQGSNLMQIVGYNAEILINDSIHFFTSK